MLDGVLERFKTRRAPRGSARCSRVFADLDAETRHLPASSTTSSRAIVARRRRGAQPLRAPEPKPAKAHWARQVRAPRGGGSRTQRSRGRAVLLLRYRSFFSAFEPLLGHELAWPDSHAFVVLRAGAAAPSRSCARSRGRRGQGLGSWRGRCQAVDSRAAARVGGGGPRWAGSSPTPACRSSPKSLGKATCCARSQGQARGTSGSFSSAGGTQGAAHRPGAELLRLGLSCASALGARRALAGTRGTTPLRARGWLRARRWASSSPA
jgi:hypothetical protein